MTNPSCSIDGCNGRHEARGWCAKHYEQWRIHGDALHADQRSTAARFWSYVDRGDPASCWLWTGLTNDKGYGLLSVDARHVRAHRYAYELLVGPIPPGFEVDHVWRRGCRSKSCVNPGHLEAVSKRENTRRIADKVTCRNGHLWSEHAYVRPDGRGRQCRACQQDRERMRGSRRR
jgi:hypothetical protein